MLATRPSVARLASFPIWGAARVVAAKRPLAKSVSENFIVKRGFGLGVTARVIEMKKWILMML